MFYRTFLKVFAISFFHFSPAIAAGLEVKQLQQEWAEIKYRQPKDSQEPRFAELTRRAEQIVHRAPNDPEALIWFGIIEGSYAGAKGGLGALSIVKNAKKSFERAIEIEPHAMEGSALTSLGSLYYQVPGWPLGFGDDKKAVEYLKKGLAINPDGIDSNFFYGDFLYRSGDLDAAERALKKALDAPPRPDRALADEGRKGEIQALLDKIRDKRR